MGFFVAFFVALAFAVVGELLRPKQKPNNAKPSSLDDFSVPTAEEGRIIPVVCGKVKIDGSNVTWYGDLEVVPITKKVKTGWFSSARQTIGHKYYMGMQMFLCHARADLEIHEIRFGDSQPSHSRADEANGVVRFDFNDENFYGGNEKEGGITGTLRLYRGRDDQPANAYIGSVLGLSPAPAYQGFAHAILEHLYLGTSSYIKPIGFIVSTYPNTLGVTTNRHKIGDDANPICFIYEIINNDVWGLNVNAARFNTARWLAAAERVFDEGYGISMIVNGGSTAEDLIDEILRHIDGVVYTDPATGLLEISLARADYDVDTIPSFTPDDMVAAPKFSRASWSQTKNTIKVSYVERDNNFTESVVSQQDLANIQQREGEIATEEIQFLGFSNWTAANRACARALKTMAYPLAKVSLSLNRTAWTLRPGSVFKLTWPARGLNGVVMRVIRIDYGNLKQNRVDIEAVEDIFAISQSAYDQPPPSGWVDPVGTPLPLVRSDLFELPYEFIGTDGIHVATLGSRASGIDEGYDIRSGLASGDVNLTFKDKVYDFTPSAVTTASYSSGTPSRDPTGFGVSTVVHGSEIPATVTEEELLAGDSIWLIRSGAGDELVAAKNFTGTQVSDVIRGVYGTVPLTHPAGATVWYLSGGFGVENPTPYTGLPKTVYAKLLPFNVRGVLPIASATQKSLVLTGRAAKPYPVRFLRINALVDPASITGDAVVTWEFVNPATRGGRITAAGSGSDPVTPGTTFTVRVFVNNVVTRTVTGLTTPTYTYTVADRLADSANTAHQVKFEVTVVTGSQTSAANTTANTTMTSAATAVSITTASLPGAVRNAGYVAALAATGGAGAPYTWSVSSGALPSGIAIDNANQRLFGTTAAAVGTYNVTLRADSPAGVFGTRALSIVVT